MFPTSLELGSVDKEEREVVMHGINKKKFYIGGKDIVRCEKGFSRKEKQKHLFEKAFTV